MFQKNETRQNRIDRLKGSFTTLSKAQKALEFVRYERAASGSLATPVGVPKQYYEDHRDALWQMLAQDCDGNKHLAERFAALARKRPSEPFIKA